MLSWFSASQYKPSLLQRLQLLIAELQKRNLYLRLNFIQMKISKLCLFFNYMYLFSYSPFTVCIHVASSLSSSNGANVHSANGLWLCSLFVSLSSLFFLLYSISCITLILLRVITPPPQGGGGSTPIHELHVYTVGRCCCEGYGFHRVYSRIGYRNQRVLV